MKEIIIKFEPFAFKQTVFIKDLEIGEIQRQTVAQSELALFIALHADELTKVHFFGNKTFAEKLKKDFFNTYSIAKGKNI